MEKKISRQDFTMGKYEIAQSNFTLNSSPECDCRIVFNTGVLPVLIADDVNKIVK